MKVHNHRCAGSKKRVEQRDTATPEEVRVDSGEAEQEAGWVLSSGELQKEQKTFPPIDKDPRSQWDFRIGKNGVLEHFRTEDGRVAVRESGDKIEILDQDHDSLELALERAVERFGGYLHFDGNQALSCSVFWASLRRGRQGISGEVAAVPLHRLVLER